MTNSKLRIGKDNGRWSNLIRDVQSEVNDDDDISMPDIKKIPEPTKQQVLIDELLHWPDDTPETKAITADEQELCRPSTW